MEVKEGKSYLWKETCWKNGAKILMKPPCIVKVLRICSYPNDNAVQVMTANGVSWAHIDDLYEIHDNPMKQIEIAPISTKEIFK